MPGPLLLSIVLFALFGHPSFVRADGIRNPFQGAAAIAQGNAFAAQADDPTAVFYNPAGMTQLHGVQHTAGVQFVSVNTHFTSPTGVSTRNEQPFPIGLPPPGQLFITANLKDLGVHALGNLSVGLGLQNLFGFVAEYPRDGPFASAVTFAQFPLIDIKPTIAYKVTDRLSVGLGTDIFTFVPWSNAVSIGVGTEYRWLSFPSHPAWNVALRTGYLHSQQTIPDVNCNPAGPDARSHAQSVGIGFLCKENGRFLGLLTCGSKAGFFGRNTLGIDMVYQALLFESRTVTGNPNPTVNDTYQPPTHAGSVTMRVNF